MILEVSVEPSRLYTAVYIMSLSSFTEIESVSLYSTVHVCTSQVFEVM